MNEGGLYLKLCEGEEVQHTVIFLYNFKELLFFHLIQVCLASI